MIGLHTYYQQVADLTLKTLKFCTPWDSVGYLHNLAWQAVRLFPEFLTHVTSAVGKCIPSGPTKDILIKQLTWEGFNTVTHNATACVRNEDKHKWILATHDIDT